MASVYDAHGNEVDIQDWRMRSLRDDIHRVTIIRERNGKFLLTPTLFWACWAGIITGYVLFLVFGAAAIAFWSWPLALASTFAVVVTVVANYFAIAYYTRHGMPKRVQPADKVELYCKSCQTKLEDELEVGREQRAQELLTELQSLGLSDIVINNRQLPEGNDHA